jgi:hypothetical protein
MESRWAVNVLIGLCWVVLRLLVLIYRAPYCAYCFRWPVWTPFLPTILGTLGIDRLSVRVFDLSLYHREAFYLFIRLRTLSQVMTRRLIRSAHCMFSDSRNHSVTFGPYESEIALVTICLSRFILMSAVSIAHRSGRKRIVKGI